MQKQLKYSIKSCSKKFRQGKEENAKNGVFFSLILTTIFRKKSDCQIYFCVNFRNFAVILLLT